MHCLKWFCNNHKTDSVSTLCSEPKKTAPSALSCTDSFGPEIITRFWICVDISVKIFHWLSSHHFPPVNWKQYWLDNYPTASFINTNVHQSQEEMDQNQAYGTIQTSQPLDAVQELVSVCYNEHHKLIRRSFLHSDFRVENSAVSWFI